MYGYGEHIGEAHLRHDLLTTTIPWGVCLIFDSIRDLKNEVDD
jgi:hypothetical protein